MIAHAGNDALIARYEHLRHDQQELARRAQAIEDELIQLEAQLPADYLFSGDLPCDELDDCDDEITADEAQRIVEDLVGFKFDGVPAPFIEQAVRKALVRLAAQLDDI